MGAFPPQHRGLLVFIAQGFGIGRSLVAPGTLALAPGLILTGLLYQLHDLRAYLICALILAAIAVPVASHAEYALGRRDDPSIVIDEIVALPFCFLLWLWQSVGGTDQPWPSLAWLIKPPQLYHILWHLVLFRLFDVWKPFPVRQAQNFWRGLGIVMDDLTAALWVNVSWFLISTFARI